MDWLLSLPDPRDDDGEGFAGGVLKPLRPSATQPRLPSRNPPAPAGRTPAISATGATTANRMRRPGSAQHSAANKLTRPSLALSMSSGTMNVSGAGGNTMAGKRPPPSGLAAGGGARGGGGGGATLSSSATDPSLARPKQFVGNGLSRTQSGSLLPARRGPTDGGLSRNGGLPRTTSSGVLTPYNSQLPAASAPSASKKVLHAPPSGGERGGGERGGGGAAASAATPAAAASAATPSSWRCV